MASYIQLTIVVDGDKAIPTVVVNPYQVYNQNIVFSPASVKEGWRVNSIHRAVLEFAERWEDEDEKN